MIVVDWQKYLENETEKYKKLGYVECPAFSNEKIYFNHYGLRHLVYKGEKVRTKEEIIKRFKLLPYVSNILKKVKSTDDEEKSVNKTPVAYFWTIKYPVHTELRVRIIIRRLNDGTLHFFSIMKE
jgi:hypothetical protein